MKAEMDRQLDAVLAGIEGTGAARMVNAVLAILQQPEAVELLKRLYKRCEDSYDVIGMALCEVGSSRFDVLLADGAAVQYAILASLEQQEAALSLQFIGSMKNQSACIFLKAMAEYQAERYDKCRLLLEQALNELAEFPNWETVHFYLGNCLFKQGEYLAAAESYYKALSLRKSMYEARANVQLAVQRILGGAATGSLVPYCFGSELTVSSTADETLLRGLPIFINSRDRVGCLKQLVDWLLSNNYYNIYILDNASTYQPLLDSYDSLQMLPGVNVIYLRANMGHLALFKSGLLEKLNITQPFVYTDSDVVPIAECPSDVLRILLSALESNPYIMKAGLSLKLDDLTCDGRDEIIAWEKRFLQVHKAAGQYYSVVDTTFALYRNVRYHTRNAAVRLDYPYQARHLPWYYKKSELPPDEAYYMEHANSSSTFSRFYKQDECDYFELHGK